MPKLLIVDDEPGVLYSFRRVFGDQMDILTAATAVEGLRQFHAERPDVLILDLQLPDRSGMEVFEEVHAANPRLPVIFITAHGTRHTAIEARKRGAFDYLIKPVDFDQVNDLLRRAFETVMPALEVVD
jgi:two-component system nitrogen regulation response regulator GlnG